MKLTITGQKKPLISSLLHVDCSNFEPPLQKTSWEFRLFNTCVLLWTELVKFDKEATAANNWWEPWQLGMFEDALFLKYYLSYCFWRGRLIFSKILWWIQFAPLLLLSIAPVYILNGSNFSLPVKHFSHKTAWGEQYSLRGSPTMWDRPTAKQGLSRFWPSGWVFTPEINHRTANVGRDLWKDPVQRPAKAGSPRAGDTGTRPGELGMSPERSLEMSPRPPRAASFSVLPPSWKRVM